jgi:ABC-type proline/glycine betaine transport system substrate-binding protein
MTDTEKPEDWEPWMDNPLQVDQETGTVIHVAPKYVMQDRQPSGAWQDWDHPRTDRDEVTSIQAFHLNKDPDDDGLRVWRCDVTWTLDEVPGHGPGQTPPSEILARNAANLANKNQ